MSRYSSVPTPARANISKVVKDVQVACMNKLYKGIGFRNDNGGIEFFSPDTQKLLCSNIVDEISILRDRLELCQSELVTVTYELLKGKEHIEEWNAILTKREEDCRQAQAQLDCFLSQSKQANGSDPKLYNILKTELRHAITLRDETCRLVSMYRECMIRKCYLDLYMQELNAKIEQKEKDMLASSTFTVGQPGILTLPYISENISKSCCLFCDVFDYLAYVCFANDPDTSSNFPKQCDSIVLNDPRNFLKFMLSCDNYDQIYCFFPNTISGMTMEETITKRYTPCAKSMSHLYADYVTLFDYSTKTDKSPLSLVK